MFLRNEPGAGKLCCAQDKKQTGACWLGGWIGQTAVLCAALNSDQWKRYWKDPPEVLRTQIFHDCYWDIDNNADVRYNE